MTSPYAVHPLDVHDDALLARAHEIMRRAALEDGRPFMTMWSLERMTVVVREPGEDEEIALLGAFPIDAPPGPDTLVGVAFVHRDLASNTDKTFADLYVEPDRRRRGIGRALADGIAADSAARGRPQVIGDAKVPFAEREDGPTMRFAAATGFRLALLEIVRELTLPVDDALLDRLHDAAAPRFADYDVVLVDGIPEERLLPSYVDLLNQLSVEAPSGDLDFEEEAQTVSGVRDYLQKRIDGGQRVLMALAVHRDEPDVVVAHSDLIAPRGEAYVYQENTLVRRDHRGHKLGTLVKVANLRQLQRLLPERTRVITQNAEVNEAMIGINEELGFAAVAAAPGFLRVLEPTGGDA